MKAIDLFAGCGGFSLGFENAGIEIVAAFDNWDEAIEVYKENFNHKIIKMDLQEPKDYEIFDKYSPDIILGGPPCQDFSSAGLRNEHLGRADLTISFAEITTGVKPKYFVMENVERIKKSWILEYIINFFHDEGYGLSQKVLNGSLCGVPQSRKRYFLIGEKNGEDHFLEAYLEKNLSDEKMTVYDYLGDDLGIEYYYRHPRTYQRRGIFSIYEPSPTIRGVNRPIPKNYKKHPGDKADVTDSSRALTTIERSYLQTFPKDFCFHGTKSNLEQMIGNAVPVKMAEYVAKCLLEYINDKKNNKQIKVPKKNVQLALF